jgi:3-oxoacyl-[acyl-carrier-protein] synthase II
MKSPIHVTGIGLVSPLGVDRDKIVTAALRRENTIGNSEAYGGISSVASVRDFSVEDFIEKKRARRMEDSNVFALASAKLALTHAELPPDLYAGCGVILGTGFSGFQSFINHYEKLLQVGIEKLSPLHFPYTVSNATAGLVAIEHKLQGPNSTITGIGTSGEYALFYACLLLMQGAADRLLVMSTECLSAPLLDGFRALGILADTGSDPSLPYAKNRRGFHLGEGSAALLLETDKAMRSRGAKSLGRIEGFGFTQNPTSVYGFGNSTSAMRVSFQQAMSRAEVKPEDIAWVSSAANGSIPMDTLEARGLVESFNKNTTRIRPLKSFTGECSSSGIVRAAIGLLCAATASCPETPCLESDLPELEEFLQPGLTQAPKQTTRFLQHSMAPGGGSAAVVISGERQP